MRVLLVGASPLSTGQVFGTERVVVGLAEHLPAWGVDAHIAAHALAPGEVTAATEMSSQRHVLPPLPGPERRQIYQVRNAAPGFADLLETLQPDIVQFHGLSARTSNRRHIEIARELGCRTFLWHNVPGITCLQKGLMRYGTMPCDGEIRVNRCTACRLRASGLAAPAAYLAARAGLGAASQLLPRRPAAVAGARWLTATFQAATRAQFDNLDAVLIGAEWVRDVLMRNGVPADKLHLIRPGADLADDTGATADEASLWHRSGPSRPLRLIYWGRIDRSKGVHTVWEALALAPELDIEVAIIGGAKPDKPYGRALLDAARRDPRLRLAGYVPAAEILPTLRTADIALIPSRWHETGPITVFEARAGGLPIIGADRGGVGELLVDDGGARLFPPEDAIALAGILKELAENRALVAEMHKQVRVARTMDEVASEVVSVYERLLRRHRPMTTPKHR